MTTTAQPAEPLRSDQFLVRIADQSLDTVREATNSFIDTNLREMTLPVLALLSEAVQKIRLAQRYLHPEGI